MTWPLPMPGYCSLPTTKKMTQWRSIEALPTAGMQRFRMWSPNRPLRLDG